MGDWEQALFDKIKNQEKLDYNELQCIERCLKLTQVLTNTRNIKMTGNELLIKVGMIVSKHPNAEVVIRDRYGNDYRISDVCDSKDVIAIKLEQSICEDDGK